MAANVAEFGTGAMNIDGCRVPGEPWTFGTQADIRGGGYNSQRPSDGHVHAKNVQGGENGRWPANLIHDGSEEVVELFPHSKSGAMAEVPRNSDVEDARNCYSKWGGNIVSAPIDASEGSAARFFYCAKASRADRNEGLETGCDPAVGTNATMRQIEDADWKKRNGNHHPTVKPTDLMRYLCRLVTPPGGMVLDPFTGSGSTGKAAILEGFGFTGLEREENYCGIAAARLAHALAEVQKPKQAELFGAG